MLRELELPRDPYQERELLSTRDLCEQRELE